MKHIGKFFFIVILLLFYSHFIEAQVLHITGTVLKSMKKSNAKGKTQMPLSVPVYIFDNSKDAAKQAANFRNKNKGIRTEVNIRSNSVVTSDYDGHFEADVSAKGALMAIDENEVKVVNISTALTYQIIFTGEEKSILLSTVTASAKRLGTKIVEMKPIDDGPSLHWNVTVNLPKGYTNESSRLIFQPLVIDCDEEDTIQYLEPLVYEGEKYHENQIKRKSYDYYKNDPLSQFFIADKPLTDDPFTFNWEIIYPKPNPNKSYKWGSIIHLEDYNEVYFEDKSKHGTCNSRKPWKFLDVSMSKKPINLSVAYYEKPRAQLREIPRNLQLTFILGKDELIADEVNKKNLEQLIKELKSYGSSLINFTIQGTASPEGNIVFNTKLANSRAYKALSLVRNQISISSLEVKKPLIYSWNDVVDSLKNRGLNSEALKLKSYIESNNKIGIREIQFKPVVQEILSNQRIMSCTYTVRENKVLDPKEALWCYYNDSDYKEGGINKFSNGDYYNLFKQIKDSAELRRLTFRAWEENKVRRTMKYSPFAAYIANRVACYAIEEDSIDLSILAPFIDMKAGVEVTRPISFDNNYNYMVNRQEIVANQAIMYFRAMKLGEAYHLASKLPNTSEFKAIKMFVDLETLFFKQGKTRDEEKRAKEALTYALNSSRENEIVLNFELVDELGKTYEEIAPLINSLPNNNAKKWYMKGIIEALKPEISDDEFMELAKKYGSDVALQMTDNTNPIYLAYFQHCFDLNPQYKKYFYSDANIPDDIRKKSPYDIKKIEVYRQKFNDLIINSNKDNSENLLK